MLGQERSRSFDQKSFLQNRSNTLTKLNQATKRSQQSSTEVFRQVKQKANKTMTITNNNYPIQGDESIMSTKKHGTSNTPVQTDLRWGCNTDIADRICNFNRHYAGKFFYSAYLFICI